MAGARPQRRAARRLLAATALSVAVTAAAAGPARGQPTPDARLALLSGIRANSGALGDRYYFGIAFGVEAAKQLLAKPIPWIDWPVRLDVGATILAAYCFEGTRADLNVDPNLWLLEAGVGPRVRLPLGGERANVFAVAGADLEVLRAEAPIPPENEQAYLGLAASGGLEVAVARNLVLEVGARHGLMGRFWGLGGPSGLTILVSLGVGE